MLGEDLVLFRDRDGAVAAQRLVSRCLHRALACPWASTLARR